MNSINIDNPINHNSKRAPYAGYVQTDCFAKIARNVQIKEN